MKKMQTIDINCDMGEGLHHDAMIMPFISSANIACGYHAGNETIMKQTVELALAKRVSIGAHPGFADKANFGRTDMQLSSAEIYALVTEQIYLLKKITDSFGARLHHVKPHGALYNMSAKDPVLANTIAKAVYDFDSSLLLFGLSGSYSISAAKQAGLKTVSEVFADRTYQDNGSLTPRNMANALIDATDNCSKQVVEMILQKTVTSVTGIPVPIIAETICLHGDGNQAVHFAATIYQVLQQHQIPIQSTLQ